MIAALLFANPWPWWLALPVVIALAVLLGWLYQRERRQVSTATGWLLTALRVALALMLFATLFEPIFSMQITQTRHDRLLLMVDESLSMTIQDDDKGPTRAEQVRQVLNAGLLKKMQTGSQLSAHRVTSTATTFDPALPWGVPDGDSTDLGRPIMTTVNELGAEPIGAVVLISDGGHNRGPNPLHMAARLAERKIKLHTIGVGPTSPPKDVSVAEVATTGLVFAGDQATAMVTLATSGYRGRPIPVRVLQQGKVVGGAALTPSTDSGRDTVAVSFVPEGEGGQALRVEAGAQPDEKNRDNNARDFRVQVLKDKLKVLFVESDPRWEFRYLKNDLLRDKAVSLGTILFSEPSHPALPASRQDWFKNAIVILGDVTPQQLGPEAEQQLESFVADNGGALIVIAGQRAMPAAWRGRRMADLLPVIGASETKETGELKIQLTPASRESPLTRLSPDPADNEKLWASLPAFHWQAPLASVKPGAEVLLATQDAPLLVTQYYGIGKVLFMGSDGTWRWRYKVADEYFHRFWGQIIRWAARSIFTARDEHVMIGTRQDEFFEGDAASVEARVLGPDFTTLNDAPVTAVISQAGQPIRRTRMDYVVGTGGLYRAAIADLPAGEYTLQLEVPALTPPLSKAAASFVVRKRPMLEMLDTAMNEELLKQMAGMTGGKYYRLADAPKLADELKSLEHRERVAREIELWDSPWWFALFAALIITEWAVRKWKGLV
jgi:hypothetical protein